MAPSAGTRWSRRMRSATAASTTRTATTNAALQEGPIDRAGMELQKLHYRVDGVDVPQETERN